MTGRRWVRRTGLHLSLLALAHLLPGSAGRLSAQVTTVQGWLTSVFTEEAPPAPPLRYLFSEAGGRRLELLLDASTARALGGAALRRGFRAEVEVDSQPAAVRAPGPNATPVHRAIRVSPLSPPAAESRVLAPSAYPYVTILCRFADIAYEPYPPSQVATRMGSSFPGADHYFNELSEGRVSLAGSVTVGWYPLPRPRSDYVSGTNLNFTLITSDCLQAADPDVFFPQYQGIVLQFNAGLSVRSVSPYDTLSFGGSTFQTLDGVSRVYATVWMSREHTFNYVVLHHELGHSLGWPHSSGPYGATYDSKWDIMSRGYIYQDPVVGWLGPHTVAYHKELSGWYDPSRVWTLGVSAPVSFLLVRTALPPAGVGFQAAILPLPNSSRFYTVESRQVMGYDRGFPGSGVLIHEVDPARLDRTAQVVDVDNNGDPNDAGATWLPGETFVDPVAGYTVRVDSTATDGYWVTIRSLAFSLTAAGRAGSAPVGSSQAQRDSVGLLLAGAGADTVSWTVGHRPAASWITLVDTAGTGSGPIRWERQPAGLGKGRYLDTLTVSAGGSALFVVDTFDVLGPFTATVSPAHIRDSAPQGARATGFGSATLTLAGFGGDTMSWVATHGAVWATLATVSGRGSASIVWSRNPVGLAPGFHVDTVTVTLASGSAGSLSVIDTLLIYEPQVSVACATATLTSTGTCLGQVERDYLDATGNRDGTYNLGDLLAWLDRKGITLTPVILDGVVERAGEGPDSTRASRGGSDQRQRRR